MIPAYIPIIKAKKAEFKALSYLPKNTSKKIIPFFEIPRITDSIRNAKRFIGSKHLTQDYLDELIDNIADVRIGLNAIVDIFRWAPNANTEAGEHVFSYIYGRLMSKGVTMTWSIFLLRPS